MAITVDNTRNDIITSALKLIGAIAADETATASDIQDGARHLNWMVKSWQADGAHLWLRDEFTLFLQKGQESYDLGDGATTQANATESYTETTLSAAAVAGATTVSLTVATGLAANDFLLIEQDDGTLHSATVSSTGPLVFTPALTDDAASGNKAYFFTTKIQKPLRVPDARRRANSQDIEMGELSREEYFNLPNKSTQGTPVQFYYDPKQTFGRLYVWSTASDAVTQIKATYYKPVDVFDNAGDTANFPNEWIEAIVYNLAVRIAPLYGLSPRQDIREMAAGLYNKVLTWDQGDASVKFELDTFGRR